MSTIDLQKIVNDIQAVETHYELMQYLGKLWVEFDKQLRNKNEEFLNTIHCVQKLIYQLSRNTTPQRAFVYGKYYEKFDNLVENYHSEKVQLQRTSILSQVLPKNCLTIYIKTVW